ncbi:Flp pilus assembly complex ATPase component TadA [Fictibacillus sp. 5RED26]|uniref:ATPase, T2SS/T4P/T4SS family n=1 Tax=Fictibacillus sp. 5RED26 TaxID=2745876 RepID=UPI0018CF76EA|nr:ATPase, T2SS/T4P/T4SS family [Fictibacillus sp. 5RED26]MBH0158736.1 Flp pilus assembly complex ATPase component TadA [Fictibacillus sp. 5RED26]
MTTKTSERFSINEYLSQQNHTGFIKKNASFYDIVERAKQFVKEEINNRIEQDNKQEDFVENMHRSAMGDKIARKSILVIIDDFLLKNAISEVEIPDYYSELNNAIFEEAYGWGPLGQWRNVLINSPKAQVIGKDIFIDKNGRYVKAPYSFQTIEKVYELTERLKNTDRKNKLDAIQHTELLTTTMDGIRVTISIPGRTIEPVITFRRQIVKTYDLSTQVKLNTIPQEAVLLLEILAKMPFSSIIGGPPECGKSTFLMTLLNGSEDLSRTGFIESSFEMYPRIHFPGEQIIHKQGTGKELETVVFPTLLREDIKRLVMAEIREDEAEIFASGMTRGITQVMGTIHESDPIDIPDILATISLRNKREGGNKYAEYLRFAKALHFSISMDAIDDPKHEKKVTGIQFYHVDEDTLDVSIWKVMDYDWEQDTWTYHHEIPNNIKRLAYKKNRKEMVTLQKALEELSEKYPMKVEERRKTGYTFKVLRGSGF